MADFKDVKKGGSSTATKGRKYSFQDWKNESEGTDAYEREAKSQGLVERKKPPRRGKK